MCANTTKCDKVITCNDTSVRGSAEQNKVTEWKMKQWWGWFCFGDGIKSSRNKKDNFKAEFFFGQKWYL